MTNHTDTSRSDDLVADIRKQAAIQIGFDGPAYQTLTRWADRIEAIEAEVERLNSLINATANHWLDLQHDHPIAWEGAVDAAMEAACDEIRRLSAALGEKQ